jgi:hypothetical protein
MKILCFQVAATVELEILDPVKLTIRLEGEKEINSPLTSTTFGVVEMPVPVAFGTRGA